MWLTYIVTLLGGLVAIVLATLCVACGLFYAAEMAEEHVVLTGKVLKWSHRVILGGHALILVDGGLPRTSIFVGIICHLCYGLLLLDYPRIDAASPAAAASLIALIVDHFLWFSYLVSSNEEAIRLPMINAIGLFILLVWFIPVACFLSLSVNDLALPMGSTNTELRSTSLFKYFFHSVSSLFHGLFNSAQASSSSYARRRHDKPF